MKKITDKEFDLDSFGLVLSGGKRVDEVYAPGKHLETFFKNYSHMLSKYMNNLTERYYYELCLDRITEVREFYEKNKDSFSEDEIRGYQTCSHMANMLYEKLNNP